MFAGLMGLLAYFVVLVAPLVLVLVFRTETHRNLVFELGKAFALSGIGIIALQPWLASRYRFIERPYGLDMVLRFHKYMAVLALGLLVAHPVLLAVGEAGWALFFSLDQAWYIYAGKLALTVFLVNGILSLYQERLGIKFEKWRNWHNVLAPATLVLAFLHSGFAADDVRYVPAMVAWWFLLPVAGALVFFHHRILVPRAKAKAPYIVSEVKEIAPKVWNVTMEPPEGRAVGDYLPGQFHFLTFFRGEGLPVEEHHWTISSSPTQKGFVASTIKELGDFTSTMGKTRPGDKVAVEGPFGRFSYALHPREKNLAFIAGGIGVTPLMSMLRHMADTRSDTRVTFLYANSDQENIAFADELDAMHKAEYPRLSLVHVLSDPKQGWEGETGFIDKEKIRKYCKDQLGDGVFYLCGPPGLVSAAVRSLKALGVEDDRIRLEIFTFLS
ncbi:MAG: ferredoxin reductase family protein [Deltaproteobacteria bacterium]|nr:ferredoxin reductase family protein [Deltaproteobacteria bacterium]